MLDKKNRTPQEVAEDNIREKRDHEEKLKRIEFDKDKDDDDIVKKEMEIKRLQTLLAQPGLTVAQKRLYQQQLNTLLGAAPVAGEAGGGEGGGAPAMSPTDAASSLQVENPELYQYLQDDVQPFMVSTAGRTDEGNVEQAYLKVAGLVGTKITPQNVHQVGPLIFSMFTEEALTRMLASMEDSNEIALGWYEEGPSNLTHKHIYEFFKALKEGRIPPSLDSNYEPPPQGQLPPPVIPTGY